MREKLDEILSTVYQCSACHRIMLARKSEGVMWCENSSCSEVGVWLKTPERISQEAEAVTKYMYQFAPPSAW